MRRRNIASVLFVLLVCLIVGIGFGRGWFRVSSTEDTSRDEVHVDLTLDRGKFQGDAEKAVDKTEKEASQLSDSIKHGTSKSDGRVHDESANP
jgi:hypothetical protein